MFEQCLCFNGEQTSKTRPCALMKATLHSAGIVTTGSTMVEHNYYVSAYRILYSDDGQRWTVYREPGVEQDKVK